MNPYQAYGESTSVEWTRIDMLLALFQTAIQRIESAISALNSGQDSTAIPLLSRAQVLVGQLAAGVDPNGVEAVNILRLYDFVVHALSERTIDRVQAALQVLQTLHEGFQSIREEAVALERSGALPGLVNARFVQTMA